MRPDQVANMPVDVVRSPRRRRTVHADVTNGRLRVLIPAGMDEESEAQIVARMVDRLRSKLATEEVDLMARADSLARRYRLPRPTSIEWSGRQRLRWGSCTPSRGTIRISNRLANVPMWVLDSVIVHELAHLVEPNHSRRFQELVGRYDLGERATGYLMALGDKGWLEPVVDGDGVDGSEVGDLGE